MYRGCDGKCDEVSWWHFGLVIGAWVLILASSSLCVESTGSPCVCVGYFFFFLLQSSWWKTRSPGFISSQSLSETCGSCLRATHTGWFLLLRRTWVKFREKNFTKLCIYHLWSALYNNIAALELPTLCSDSQVSEFAVFASVSSRRVGRCVM